MVDDSELLQEQLKVNEHRIKKLEEHKKLTESQLKDPKFKTKHEMLKETMKRLDYNLQFEYKQKDGILSAMNSID